MTVQEARKFAAQEISGVAGEEAVQQADLLVAFCIEENAMLLPLSAKRVLSREEELLLVSLLARRCAHEPVQYLLGLWSFCGHPIRVDHRALIPRPETEEIVAYALERVAARHYRTALDLCAGTGCIGVALAKGANLSVTMADISADCIALCRENAALNGITAQFCEGDLFDAVSETYDLIVANPPYLTEAELSGMQQELNYEPRLALDGGGDGLLFYRRIAETYAAHLSENGLLLLEIGALQGRDVVALFGCGEIKKDMFGNDRFFVLDRFCKQEEACLKN